MAAEEPPVAGEELPIAGKELPVAGAKLPMTGEELPVALAELPMAGEEPPDSLLITRKSPAWWCSVEDGSIVGSPLSMTALIAAIAGLLEMTPS